MYVAFDRPGFWAGNTAEARDQVMRAKTIAQLQLRPILTPAIRPSVKVGFSGAS